MKVAMVACVALVSLALLAQSANRPSRESRNDSLGMLARATTLAELETLLSRATKDFPHRAIYAAKYVELKGKDADSVLLRSLPNNGKQMEQLYEAQDTRDGQDLAVTEAYN